jgi:hypothetical protein
LQYLFPIAPLLKLRSLLLLICLHLIIIKSVIGIIKFEPLEQIKASTGYRPIDNNLHLPNKGNSLISLPDGIHKTARISAKSLLIRLHGIAMLDLQSRIVEVAAPKEIVNDKPWIIVDGCQLEERDYESKVNVYYHYKAIVDHQLER